MADQVYLSLWLRGYTAENMLRHFDRAIERFPFSRLRPGATLRVYALEFAEPPALEHRFGSEVNSDEVAAMAREFQNADCAYQLDANWDLWRFDADWRLGPAPVTLTCFGPEFESDYGEQIQFELGQDNLFLPPTEAPAGLRAVQSNIRSVLHLADDLRGSLPVEKLTLWSESGESLSEKLADLLEDPYGD